jgi:hypothetical protein
MLSRFAHLGEGQLRIEHEGCIHEFGEAAAPTGLRAILDVRDERFWETVLLSGLEGAGRAYGAGWWSADDLNAVVRVLLRNGRRLQIGEGPLSMGIGTLFLRGERRTANGASWRALRTAVARRGATQGEAAETGWVGLDDLGAEPVRTLQGWYESMLQHEGSLRTLGYPDRMLWELEFFLSTCIVALEEGALSDVRMRAVPSRHPAFERGIIGA